jgi:hypothetical protein
MKRSCFLALVLAVAAGSGGLIAQPAKDTEFFPNDATLERALSIRLSLRNPGLNEIDHRRVSFDGVLVTAVRSHRLWELVNPAAPPEYGALADTVVLDPITGRMSGLNLFSIRF